MLRKLPPAPKYTPEQLRVLAEWMRGPSGRTAGTDIDTGDYRPAIEQGPVYAGLQPREYLQDPDPSEPIDIDAEAARFATWARQVLGVAVTSAQVRHTLADIGEADAREDTVERTLERTVERLVSLLGLPLPGELRATADS